MKINKYIVFACAYLLVGCQHYAYKKYHLGRIFSFQKKQDYISLIQKDAVLRTCNVMVLDRLHFSDFYKEILQPCKSKIYLGAYINDSTFLKSGSTLIQEPDCSRRIIDEIKKIILKDQFADSLLLYGNDVRKYNLQLINTVENNTKGAEKKGIRIYVTYSYTYGNYYHSLYKKINTFCQQSNFKISLYLISIDPFYQLK